MLFILILASLNVLQAYRLTKSQWSPAESFPPTLQNLQYYPSVLHDVIAAAATAETGVLAPCVEVRFFHLNRQFGWRGWRRWRSWRRWRRMETYPSACVAAVSTVNWSLQRAHCSWWLPTVSAVVSALCAETEQGAEGVGAINESVYTPALHPMCCAKPVGTHVWPSCAYMLMRKRRESCCTAKNSNHSKQKETQMGSGSDCSSGLHTKCSHKDPLETAMTKCKAALNNLGQLKGRMIDLIGDAEGTGGPPWEFASKQVVPKQTGLEKMIADYEYIVRNKKIKDKVSSTPSDIKTKIEDKKKCLIVEITEKKSKNYLKCINQIKNHWAKNKDTFSKKTALHLKQEWLSKE